jgi:hypothetical protein
MSSGCAPAHAAGSARGNHGARSGDWYRAVTVLGRVVEIRDDEGLADIDRLSQRYRATPYWNRERKRATALIEPHRWHNHS